ncbi:MAG TPA: siderophore ABC transporter substrate-binding protein [Tissierellaceae bacterium]|jgi:iron complex transport system substrate-binding protein|nr:siderophore ABC transporter substrate-binding protein [Tissierellaceae bacterium]
MKNVKSMFLSIMAVVLAIGAMGCSASPEAEGATGVKTVTISHELGDTTVALNPERVVVFDYGILDSMKELGIEVIALPKQSLPAHLGEFGGMEYIDAGTLKEPNFEVIYEASPDLIIVSGRQVDMYDDFARIAPTVYMPMDNGEYLESLRNNLNILGQIFDKKEMVDEKVDDIESSIQYLNEIASDRVENGLFVMANDGNLSVYGEGSRFGVLHEEFGIPAADREIESSTHGQKITFEYIQQIDPEYIFVMDRAAVAGGEVSAKSVMDNEIIGMTRAYAEGKIIYLDAHVWYVGAGGIGSTEKMINEIISAIE